MNNICILINNKDRPTELFGLLQSLRTQTLQNFDIFIMDDQSGTTLNKYHFMNCMLMRLKLENHKVHIKRTTFNYGVSKARHEIVEWAMKEGDYDFFVRVDDDVILEQNYLEELMKVIDKGYDIASGVTVPMTSPVLERETKHLKGGIINRVILDKDGNYILNGDDCGFKYIDKKMLPAHHFRSCAMIKRKVHEKVKYYPTTLSNHGFREEQIFSYNALMEGFTIGVNTGAINYHMLTPSGGERFSNSRELIIFNQKQFLLFTKKHKDKLNKLFTKDDMPDSLELMKENNLLMLEVKIK